MGKEQTQMIENKIQLTKLVKQTLIENPNTRSDDYELFFEVLHKIISPNDVNIADKMSLKFYLLYGHKQFPKFETVSRCRRKVQELNPNLKADPAVEEFRSEEEKEFKEYARIKSFE